jgi:hypothetical protein
MPSGFEFWREHGLRAVVRSNDHVSDGALMIRAQCLADILGSAIVLYRVPALQPRDAPPWPKARRRFLHYAEPAADHFRRT